MSIPVSSLWRGVHLAVLWAFAAVQPLLDLLGDNGEFFVARGNGAGDVVVFSLALAVVPPLALLGLEALAGLISERLAWYLHLGLVALLSGAFGLLVLDGIFGAPAGILLVGATALGVLASTLYVRSEAMRSLLSFLAPAPAVFVALFLFGSDASKLVLPQDEANALTAESVERPVVMVIFDELASASLMDRRGEIDGRRFPNFAALAHDATWYRNATTVADHTDEAVPAILTGSYPGADLYPVAGDYPDNLFTLLAGSMRLNVHERTARLCPETYCEPEVESFPDRFEALVSDLGVVEAHLLLPDGLTTGLPPVNEGFSGFGVPDVDDEELPYTGVDQEAIIRFLDGIDREPQALHFIHLLIPHNPWRYLPDGSDYVHGEVWREFPGDAEIWPEDGRWVTHQGLRAHLLQTGYADAVLGRIIERVRSAGIWDDALIVVVADHGVSIVPGQPRRFAVSGNIGGIAPVPLFVKRPGQTTGRVDDRAARTIDVLPTIADLLDVELPFEVDGEPASQVDGRVRIQMLRSDEEQSRTFAWSRAIHQRNAIVRRTQRLFGRDWAGVWHMGPHSELIGRTVTAPSSVSAPGASFDLSRSDDYDRVDLEGTYIPALVTGVLEGVDAGAPLAVSVNGRIAAVTRAYDSVFGGVRASALVPPGSFRQGSNAVELYAVLERAGRPVLQPLGGTGS